MKFFSILKDFNKVWENLDTFFYFPFHQMKHALSEIEVQLHSFIVEIALCRFLQAIKRL